MDDLGERLRQLVLDACKHSPGSPQRQRLLTQIIRLTAPKLWKDSSPYYHDALQQTWVYFCQNICERGTTDPYDPDRSSVVTWLNAYLKRRLQDGYLDVQKQQATRASGQLRQSRSGEVEISDPLDNLAAEPDVPPLLEEITAWAEADVEGELRRVHIEGHPTVNCQTLILRRLPPETSWKALSAEFGLTISTLSSFYQRQCLPRLRKFGESEGYL
jgi:hypothetical protein